MISLLQSDTVPSGIDGMLAVLRGLPKPLRAFGGPTGNFEKGEILSGDSFILREVAEVLERHRARKFVADPARIMGVFASAVTGISTGVTYDGVFELPLFCVDAAENPRFLEHAVVTVGIGGSMVATSIRFPSYILPAMRILSGLEALGLPLPTVRLISAQMAAVKINGMSEDGLWPITLGSLAKAKMFAHRFFPKVAHRLTFDFDQKLEGPFLGAAESLRACVVKEGKKVRALIPAFEAMGRQGEHHGGIDGAMLYAILHVFLSPDFTVGNFGSPWISECHRNGIRDRAVITLGGDPERFFNAIRDFATANARKVFGGGMKVPCHSVRLLVGAGHIPVYNPRADEPGFDCLKALQQLRCDRVEWQKMRGNRELTTDWDMLEEAAGGWENFLGWAQEIAELIEFIPDGAGAREYFMGKVLTSTLDPLDIIEEMGGFPVASFPFRCREMRAAFLKGAQA
ncbi:MAG: hypothetical protein HYY10_01730 [Candidatus Liptonbacteria bacterium]|nr:hypothetical protein [Candidatus Liptonbacteria bacterium]